METSFVTIDGYELKMRMKGEGLSILILPGGGESIQPYYPLQDRLADKHYKVYLPELPSLPGERFSPRFMSLEDWADWLDKLLVVLSIETTVLITHSYGGRIALQYILENLQKCSAAVFISPGLTNNRWQYIFWHYLFGETVRFFHLYPFLPKGMRWMRNDNAYKSALLLLSPIKEKQELKIPSLVLVGKRDPIRILITGWKKLAGEITVQEMDWDHSPQKRAPESLVEVIDKFIKNEA